ncbi:MAG: YraN family protein [Rhodobacteraceae bacterium]|nr:YraN family protein [Paracoccaceae bacterium]
MSGARSVAAGLAAEEAVARHYAARGAEVIARRWRGPRGEIDLIAAEEGGYVFVEVKQAPDHATAMAHLTAPQIGRILSTALAFLATRPEGQAAEMRFDLATVDGQGRVALLAGAFSADDAPAGWAG